MFHYLAPYVGAGTDDDPFRPRGSEQPSWSAIDLRPDCTVLTGRALLSVPVRDDTIGAYLGDAPDEVSASVTSAVESRFGITLEATRLRQMLPELLITHAREDGTRWRPLRAMHDGVFRIYLGGLFWQARSLSGGTSATDDFASTSNPLASPWTIRLGMNYKGQAVNSHCAGINAGNFAGSYYAAAWSGDHFSRLTVIGKADHTYVAVARSDSNSPTDRTGYEFGGFPGYFGTHLWRVYKWVNGSATLLGTGANTATINDVAYIEASGSSITAKVNGTTEIGPLTDVALTGGSPGFTISDSAANFETWDTFEAGDLAVSVSLTDSVSLGLSETDALLARLTLAETLPLPLTETLDLRAAFQLSETLGLGLTETDAILARLSLADLSEMGLTDAASILGGMTVSDAVALGIIDRETILAQIPLADAAALGLDDVLLLRALLTELSDAMGVGIQESVSVAQAMAFALSDTFGLTGIEALTLGVSAVLADTVALNAEDALDLLSTFTVSDGTALTASDALSLLARFSTGDTAALDLQDSVAVNALLSLADSCGLGLAEAVTVTAGFLLADSCGLTLAEVLDILEGLAPALLLFDLPVRLLGSDDRRAALVGGDNRQAVLVGGDDRRAALVGGPPRP